MKNRPLDDFRACDFSDCPNPTLLDRLCNGEPLEGEDMERVRYYVDECDQCRKYVEACLKKRQERDETQQM